MACRVKQSRHRSTHPTYLGNPNVIVKDDNWRALLLLCVQRGVYRGVACPSIGIMDEQKQKEDTDFMLYKSLLGSGLEELMFPDEDDLEGTYMSEQPWRVMM